MWPALRADAAVGLGLVVGPDDDATTIAAVGGVGLQCGLGTEVSALRVLDLRVLALEVTTDADAACALAGRDVYCRLPGDGHAVAQHIDLTAPAAAAAAGHDGCGAVHNGVACGLEQHPATFYRGAGGLNLAAVAQGAGKHAHRVTLQFAQVARRILWRLYQHADALQSASGDLHLLPGCQHGAAVAGLHHGTACDVDMGGDQHHVAFARHDAPTHRDAGGTAHGGIGITKTQPPGQRVGICHAQGRSGKTCGVDDGAGTDRDARLVHQHQATIRAQAAEYLRRGVGDDAVDGQAAGAGLHEVGAAARGYGETLPVDG